MLRMILLVAGICITANVSYALDRQMADKPPSYYQFGDTYVNVPSAYIGSDYLRTKPADGKIPQIKFWIHMPGFRTEHEVRGDEYSMSDEQISEKWKREKLTVYDFTFVPFDPSVVETERVAIYPVNKDLLITYRKRKNEDPELRRQTLEFVKENFILQEKPADLQYKSSTTAKENASFEIDYTSLISQLESTDKQVQGTAAKALLNFAHGRDKKASGQMIADREPDAIVKQIIDAIAKNFSHLPSEIQSGHMIYVTWNNPYVRTKMLDAYLELLKQENVYSVELASLQAVVMLQPDKEQITQVARKKLLHAMVDVLNSKKIALYPQALGNLIHMEIHDSQASKKAMELESFTCVPTENFFAVNSVEKKYACEEGTARLTREMATKYVKGKP